MRRWGLLAACLFSVLATAADPPSTHGMLLVGEKTLFASHLPMFHRPHDYQGIARISVGENVLAIYQADRAGHPNETVYTIVPEKFSLPDKLKAGATFKAALFRGHFERGGEEIVAEMKVTVAEVIHFRRLDPKETKPQTARAILFGSGKDAFAAHLISGQPDFDQVLELQGMPQPITADPVMTFADHPGDKPLPEKTDLEAGKQKVRLGRQLYLEFDDLK